MYRQIDTVHKNISQNIGQAAKWSSITEIIAKLISPITNMILARLLVPEVFGIVSTITMVISFAEIFTDAGFQKYIIQHEFTDEEALDKSTNVAFWTNLTISMFVCTIVFLFRHKIADLVGNSGLGNAISIASVLIIIASFSSIQIARYRRALDFKTLFFVRLITSLIPLVVTVPLAIIFRSYWALLIGSIASQLYNAIILTIKSKWKPKFHYSFRLFKEMFAFSAWTLLESISIWLSSYLGVFIVGKRLSDYYLGLYKTAMSTVNAYMSIITSALMPVLFSALSRYQNDDENFRKTYYQFQRLTAVLIIPMGIGIYLYRDLVTQILLGYQWGEASGFIGLWGLTSAFTIVFSHFSSEVYRSKGNPKLSLFVQILHIAFLFPTLILSIQHGFKALYVSRSFVRIQLIITALLFMHIMYGFKIQHILRNVLPMIISALIMCMVGCFLQQVNSSIIWQLVSVFICIIAYFTVLLGAFPSVRSEVFDFIGSRGMTEKIINNRIFRNCKDVLNNNQATLIERQTELSNCTFVKTVLMVIVVIYHCVVFWSGSWFTKNPIYESRFLSFLASWMNSFHIYGFTLVSGYLFYYLKHEKNKYSMFWPFVANKATRLLVPYVFVSAIWVIPFAVHFSHLGVSDVVIQYGLGTSPSQLWFLLMLFCVFLFFQPLSAFFEKHSISGAIMVAILYGMGVVGSIVLPNVLQVFRACTYIPLFWLGFKIRQYGSSILRKIPILLWLAFDILLFVINQHVSGFEGIIFKLIKLGLDFVLHIVGALMAFVILQKIADKAKWRESKVFGLLSKNSMSIYLFHQQVIYIFVTWLNGMINPYLHVVINFIGAILISLLISTVFMKFKWTRILIGEK